ncbi:dynein intermediate chain 2, ciliary-like [Neosynchiropus ocellatus]
MESDNSDNEMDNARADEDAEGLQEDGENENPDSDAEDDDSEKEDAAQDKQDDADSIEKEPPPVIDRATQTHHFPLREKGCQIEPPQCYTFAATANHWKFEHAYKSYRKKQSDQGKPKAKEPVKDIDTVLKKGYNANRVAKIAKTIERMLHQNTFDDLAQDFKYYEDAADEFRGQEGTLLPLWKFHYNKSKRLAVTALCWNKKYNDLFGVGMGSDDFSKQGNGILIFYTLKNSTFPEYIFPTASSVLCLDIHPQKSYLVAVGLYDGYVAVYNLRKKGTDPVYKSTPETGKHTDPVWEVRWQADDMANNPTFCSISADGRVVSWTLVKNELAYRDIIRLPADGVFAKGPEDAETISNVRGTSFDFHKEIDNFFLVGTEEGKIHMCSKMYSSQFLETFEAHTMPVDTIKWNTYHPKVFISCSSDWTIKVWDYTINTPMLTFDLGSAVANVAWAPYSSTVFAAVSIDGKVTVYDLGINKYDPICQQQVVAKKIKLTSIEFNPEEPLIIVGDDRSYVTSLKLSPNLRKGPKGEKGQEMPKGPEAELAKMEKLLSSLREQDQNN